MIHADHPRQALFYVVALHRYLRWRPSPVTTPTLDLVRRARPGSPRHGRNRPATVDGHPCGVFSWRPPTTSIVALSDLLDRGSENAEIGVLDVDDARWPPATGLLREFNIAGVLDVADVHTATRLGAIVGETDEDVLLAVVLAVRARVRPRLCRPGGRERPASSELDDPVDVHDLPGRTSRIGSDDSGTARSSWSEHPTRPRHDRSVSRTPGSHLDRYWR